MSKWQMGFNSAFKWLILFVLFNDYYILHMLTCMDASLKNICTVSLSTTYSTQLITSGMKNKLIP
jgi:hypothetical protein